MHGSMRSCRSACQEMYDAPGMCADVWVGKRIVVVDRLGPDFLAAVHDGERADIAADGTVTVE